MPVPGTHLTRREALALGAATGVAAAVGVTPASAGAAVVGAGSGPDYLRRSTYAALVGETFTIGSQTLRLTGVADVLGAKADASLRGLEEAFALSFEGPADAFEAGLHQMSHPLLGPFPLYAGPEGPVRDGVRAYGATIDRSVRVSLGAATQDDGPRLRATEAQLGDPSRERRRGAPPTERDREIARERRLAAMLPRSQSRAAAREARARLRAALVERVTFKREQRARLLSSRSSFLRRPGR